jgi:hypothetical protein
LTYFFGLVKCGNETIKILVQRQFLLFDSSQQVQQAMHNLVIISICIECYGKCNMTDVAALAVGCSVTMCVYTQCIIG